MVDDSPGFKGLFVGTVELITHIIETVVSGKIKAKDLNIFP